jgi:hypothetical protein
VAVVVVFERQIEELEAGASRSSPQPRAFSATKRDGGCSWPALLVIRCGCRPGAVLCVARVG